MISTKGRYALRLMVDLAQHWNGDFIPLKDVADRQEISQKYLERISLTLSQSGLIESTHGKGGGYRLAREPEEYNVLEILEKTEGDLAPVACLQCGAAPCSREAECPTVSVWRGFDKIAKDYFRSISLSDLTEQPKEFTYVI